MRVKKLITYVLMPIFGILRIFVKKENIALFIASDMYRYSGNTKYLYQYFNTHSNDKCYWITESKEVINLSLIHI